MSIVSHPANANYRDNFDRIFGKKCRGCGEPLLDKNVRFADGCLCNAPSGINHGLVPTTTCTCNECDPAQTGSVR
ncbi:MAG TPA: hypothetical protein VGY48_15555 [Vicinamibacterales bacterium]|nr:hypothetical protein [Vicinamibacterales bacterium]